MSVDYPKFIFFPKSASPPEWVEELAAVFTAQRHAIDTAGGNWNKSDAGLRLLRTGLEALDFQVETGKKRHQKLHRPVFFGEQGKPTTQYEIDAYHPGLRIVVEIEAGRSLHGGALYRDIIRLSLMADCDYAVIAVPLSYRIGPKKRSSSVYQNAAAVLDAIYGTNRLQLPFKGLLLIGY
jgi:hypothetical protein